MSIWQIWKISIIVLEVRKWKCHNWRPWWCFWFGGGGELGGSFKARSNCPGFGTLILFQSGVLMVALYKQCCFILYVNPLIFWKSGWALIKMAKYLNIPKVEGLKSLNLDSHDVRASQVSENLCRGTYITRCGTTPLENSQI